MAFPPASSAYPLSSTSSRSHLPAAPCLFFFTQPIPPAVPCALHIFFPWKAAGAMPPRPLLLPSAPQNSSRSEPPSSMASSLSPHRVTLLLCSLRSPIRDTVENRASGRRRASRLARSTKCQAMWTTHASSPDSFRLIDL
ncbi:hypothetical protein ZEAMMB73_Zm00001d035223 [Zea mays]|uniref:Uncharacterized protein n=1 Tax=Zea mays TaxID=4577 RepID=A0A1D6LF25_MAIZE|nr:hypothetical protein ZEAMMB73_Zm00001d035223 [Zea mays]